MREHRPRLFHAGNALRPIEDTLWFWRREKSQEKYVEAHGPNCRAPKKLTLVTTSERCASRHAFRGEQAPGVFWSVRPTCWSSAFRLFRAANMLKHELQQFTVAKEKTLIKRPEMRPTRLA